MRPRNVSILLVAATLTALQSAAAAETSTTARFLVSLRGTIKKGWSYTSSGLTDGCRTHVSGNGTRSISLRSRDVSVVTARRAGTAGRVIFSGTVTAIGGTIRESGTKTTRSSGPVGCEQDTQKTTCPPVTQTFRGQHARLVGGRRHTLTLGPMKRLVPDAFFNDCPGEPRAVRRISTGLGFADARLNERDIFDRSVAGLTLQGSADASTTLFNRSAKIEQHVRWTLTLRRLGG